MRGNLFTKSLGVGEGVEAGVGVGVGVLIVADHYSRIVLYGYTHVVTPMFIQSRILVEQPQDLAFNE